MMSQKKMKQTIGILILAAFTFALPAAQAMDEAAFAREAQYQRERAVDFFARRKNEKLAEQKRQAGVAQIHAERKNHALEVEHLRELYVVNRNSHPPKDEEQQEKILEQAQREDEKRHDLLRKAYARFMQRLENVKSQTGLSEQIEYNLYPPTQPAKASKLPEVQSGR